MQRVYFVLLIFVDEYGMEVTGGKAEGQDDWIIALHI
jgi:hypothetical protein